MKKINFIGYICLATLPFIGAGCSDWLDPKPKSFYVPENGFVDYNGLKTACIMLDRDLRFLEYYVPGHGQDPHFATEMTMSDIAVNARTDTPNAPQDLNNHVTPSANLNTGTNMARCHAYWRTLYKGIKDANIVVTRSESASFDNEAQKNEVLAYAYFHRALRYYRLVHMFGDVPLVLNEIMGARYDFFSTKRDVVLQYMKTDLENTIKYLPAKPNFGAVGQGAAYHLLTKINLALGKFDDAITSAGMVIDGGVHRLMKTRFGVDAADLTKNVIWDLHRADNKAIPSNTEGLYLSIDRYGNTDYQSTAGLQTMRQVIPWYTASGANMRTPDGKLGFSDNNTNPYLNKYGRGICTIRSTWYHTNTIWEPSTDEYNDLRHDTISGNWVMMENLEYNNPALLTSNPPSPWYGKRLKKKIDANDAVNAAQGNALYNDTIRVWCDWPHYKVFVPDQRPNTWAGGWGDWYIFRLAETYLLRAEAYLWKGQPDKAMADINEIRERAGARPLALGEVTMRALLDERARELFYEEPRKTELTRIAYIYAQTGKADDYGNTYTLNNFSEKNFFFEHVSKVNEFYNSGAKTISGNAYTMSAHHVLWPVPESEITVNSLGRINQNKGYKGAENNVEPIDRPN